MHIDASYTDDEISMIIDAIHQWETATSYQVSVFPIIDHHIKPMTELGNNGDGKHAIYKMFSNNPIAAGLQKKNKDHDVLGYAVVHDAEDLFLIVDTIKKNAKNNDQTYEEVFTHVVLHELGHHWGLKHPKGAKIMLMTPGYKIPGANVQCITNKDLRLFCDLYDCSGKMQSTCTNP
jgi:hypothetical protein